MASCNYAKTGATLCQQLAFEFGRLSTMKTLVDTSPKSNLTDDVKLYKMIVCGMNSESDYDTDVKQR